ncbi:electron transfer flavoprotein subunit alpha/FixB family protein [Spiribacter halobius]|uniref:Electron transfer flavoprotein subunit alpha n=1 Tax=Sediminicurvatus halobius TaxID=2182432 RepID=A0A2U2N615_9GAMM|nr:electron transfer flavoprotein subunit alpha/FixB family protein [Spiribacter halobius]PWG64626.1 electron transfer flavoprotein subunit alpha [Spiribacter halobius]UEX79051.1 electron transfer flavoprotein subunit alpha/FixB family protein [Spiribacter halobius]
MSAQPHGRRRRDPRAEREQRRRGATRAAAQAAAEPARGEASAGARRRVDPRAERGGRRRLEARGRADARGAAVPETGPGGPVAIRDPAYWILVVPDQIDGSPDARDRELLEAARRLADAEGGAVAVVDLGRGAGWPALGADRVVRPERAPQDPLPLLEALAEQLAPRHVLFTERPAAGAELGRRYAASRGGASAPHVRRLDDSSVTAAAGQGREAVHSPIPPVLLLDAGTAEPPAGRLHEARELPAPEAGAAAPVVEDLGPVPVNPDEIPLAEADFIVSAGRGVQDFAAFQRLAELLGAAAGASRPVCDAGLMPRARQVGASGTLVSARCYIALGISGAPQHLQGIADCEHVVAVNLDPHSEIMKRADLAVVGDVEAIMAALLRRLEAPT